MLYGPGATGLTTAKDMGKVYTLRSINGNGNFIFFEENEDREKVYYSLVNKNGKTLRKGEMSISSETFIDYMQRLGFEYLGGGESF